jgi:hypothetical protein
MCWNPSDTGEKTDLNTLQKKCAGAACPQLPDTPPPPNDTFNKHDTATASTTTGGITTTNTWSNYTTGTGGPAGKGNDGCTTGTTCQPGGTASGGGDCAAPPVVSDPALAMIATQAWATRCAVTAENGVTVTGDVGDCNSAFTVGPAPGAPATANANVEKLKALRAQICGLGKNPDGHDSTEAVNGSDDGTALLGTMSNDQEYGADGVDDAGYGLSRTCPYIPTVDVLGAHLDFNLPKVCDWIKVGGQFVLVLAALFSLKVLAGGTKLD